MGDTNRKTLIAGLKLNRVARCHAFVWSALGVFGPIYLVAMAVITSSPVIALFALLPFGLAFGGVTTLIRLREVTVLEDGLDDGGRFVAFLNITAVLLNKVWIINSEAHSIEVRYVWRGATFSCFIWRWFAESLDVPALARELRAAAGPQIYEAQSGERAPETAKP